MTQTKQPPANPGRFSRVPLTDFTRLAGGLLPIPLCGLTCSPECIHSDGKRTLTAAVVAA